MKNFTRTAFAALLFTAVSNAPAHAQGCWFWQPCTPPPTNPAPTQNAPEINSSKIGSGIALTVGAALIAGFALRRREVTNN